ncbi:elongator complex protein 5 [Orycteropus afer afer]|uniref:Elongator complex protein 5 n=1 Tax=Orycteropus afer afer TaxID=1230840 RepID=A0A8B7ASN0_ORYAF|nr:elongator complex protein 5 [Orycteropus afer afer]
MTPAPPAPGPPRPSSASPPGAAPRRREGERGPRVAGEAAERDTERAAQKATPGEGKAQRSRELGDRRGQPAGAHMDGERHRRLRKGCGPRQWAGQRAVTSSEGARVGAELEPKMDSLLTLGGLVLLRDSVEWEGRSLLKALIKKSALCGKQVYILGCEVSEEEFREGFDSDINSRLVYHDFFRDPLNWSKTEEALPGGPLASLRALCRRTHSDPVTIALDSLSWLLLHLPCTTVCQTLRALSHRDSHPDGSTPVERVHVLGLLHEDLHGPGPLGALSSLAQIEVTLSGMLGQLLAHILYRRPRQRPTHQTQWFSILPDFSLNLQGIPPRESQPHPDSPTTQVDPTTHLTFNLRLSKKEKEAKDSLTLPFQFSSEKQQALLRPGPGQATSRIFYEPDVYDDLDQEDPDDDLDV